MTNIARRLILVMLAQWVAISGALNAQPSTVPKPPPGAIKVEMRNLAVCFLSPSPPPELFYKTPQEEFRQLKIETSRLGSWNTIPATPILDLYKQRFIPESTQVDPITKKQTIIPSRVEYDKIASWSMPDGHGSVRKLFYYDSSGRVQQYAFDATEKSHSALELRIVNLINTKIGVRAAQQTAYISPNQESIIRPGLSPEQIFEFQYAMETVDGPYKSPIKGLQFYGPRERLTVVLANMPEAEQKLNGPQSIVRFKPEAIRLLENLDQLPKDPDPVFILPKTNSR